MIDDGIALSRSATFIQRISMEDPRLAFELSLLIVAAHCDLGALTSWPLACIFGLRDALWAS